MTCNRVVGPICGVLSYVCLKLVSLLDQFSPRGVFARASIVGLCEWEYLLIEFVSCVIISSCVIYCFWGFSTSPPKICRVCISATALDYMFVYCYGNKRFVHEYM